MKDVSFAFMKVFFFPRSYFGTCVNDILELEIKRLKMLYCSCVAVMIGVKCIFIYAKTLILLDKK